jgi:uncharacterized membrane protein
MAKKPTTPRKKTTTGKKTTTTSGKKRKPAPRSRTVRKVRAKSTGKGKGMAIVAYLLFFVPLIAGAHKKSPFVKFHTNQGTALFLVSIVLIIVLTILELIMRFLWILWALLWPLIAIVILVLAIVGIINAASGRMKPLPIVGKFRIIK